MNLAFKFLLSPDSTNFKFEHKIHPYAHWFSHQTTNANLFRSVTFPDAIPRLSDSFKLLDKDFIHLRPPRRNSIPSADEVGYDFIVTLFFIDTSLNIVSTLEQIYQLLRVGGTWINLGPLLWTGGSQAALELSLEEVLQVADHVGLHVLPDSRRTISCEYTADQTAMMTWTYHAEFWIAKKRQQVI